MCAKSAGDSIEINERQINAIEEAIAELTFKTRLLALEITYIEEEVSKFLDIYYKKILPVLLSTKRTISGTNLSIKDHLAHCNEDNIPDIDPIDKSQVFDHEIKSLYYRLARKWHPDVAEDSDHQLFSRINDAYNQRNLAELIRLDTMLAAGRAVEPMAIEKYVNKIAKEYNALAQHYEILQAKKAALIETPAYLLRKKAMWYKLQGRDLITEIKANLLQQEYAAY